MAGISKYNYDAAMQLVLESYKNGHKITYKEMQETLGLEKPIEDKSASSVTNSTLYELRNRLREKYNLVFKSASMGTHVGPDYYYYTISEVKGSNVLKKNTSVKKSESKDVNYDALSKDNQKLYEEVQRLTEYNRKLLDEVAKCRAQEDNYKNIITSLMSLAGI